jgi:thiamine pyrophosphate-dependent acetolactate synthase large subunit-like protein
MSSALDETVSRSVAQAYLALLSDRGVDYLFGKAGTDFTPIIEAYARTAQSGVAVPRPIVATHENLAVTMAHGYVVSRRIPAVMAHVSVGTANMICAAMNAARENVAILLTAGSSHGDRPVRFGEQLIRHVGPERPGATRCRRSKSWRGAISMSRS